MEEEVREILRDAQKAEAPIESGLGSEIASMFSETGLDRDIPELRGHTVQSPGFDR